MAIFNKKLTESFYQRLAITTTLSFALIILHNPIKNLDIYKQNFRQKIVIIDLKNNSETKKNVSDHNFNIIHKTFQLHYTGLSNEMEYQIANLISHECRKYGYDPYLILGMIKVESSFYNWSSSNKGAKGLMQIMPSVGRSLFEELNMEWTGSDILYDPQINIQLGIYYFSKLLKRFKDTEIALTAYSYGPTYVEKLLHNGWDLPKIYSSKVIKASNNLKYKLNRT